MNIYLPYLPFICLLLYAETCEQEYPLIDLCHGKNTCLIDSKNLNSLTCSLDCSGQFVELGWYIKQGKSNETILAKASTELSGSGIKTVLKFETANFSKVGLTRIVCKARGPGLGTRVLQSLVLVDNTSNWNDIGHASKYYGINSQAILPCAVDSKPFIYIWEKSSGEVNDLVVFGENGKQYFNDQTSSFSVTGAGSLVVQNVQLESEGTYRCKFFDGTIYGIIKQTVTVLGG